MFERSLLPQKPRGRERKGVHFVSELRTEEKCKSEIVLRK